MSAPTIPVFKIRKAIDDSWFNQFDTWFSTKKRQDIDNKLKINLKVIKLLNLLNYSTNGNKHIWNRLQKACKLLVNFAYLKSIYFSII